MKIISFSWKKTRIMQKSRKTRIKSSSMTSHYSFSRRSQMFFTRKKSFKNHTTHKTVNRLNITTQRIWNAKKSRLLTIFQLFLIFTSKFIRSLKRRILRTRNFIFYLFVRKMFVISIQERIKICQRVCVLLDDCFFDYFILSFELILNKHFYLLRDRYRISFSIFK